MKLSISTRWNAARHISGEAMLREIMELGLDHVELGYDLRMDLVPGVMEMVRTKAVTVDSVHNFCPVPMGFPVGHPELFSLSGLFSRDRDAAVRYTMATIRFAGSVGARFVVAHCGNVDMRRLSSKMFELCQAGQASGEKYEKLKMKLIMAREKKAPKHFEALCRSLEELFPVLRETGTVLALENLPSWESIPTEVELQGLLEKYPAQPLCYWHDTGHAQIRENMGFINHHHWLKKLAPRLGGMHLHDVKGYVHDHLAPSLGDIDFAALGKLVPPETVLVLEPAPDTDAMDIQRGIETVKTVWPSIS